MRDKLISAIEEFSDESTVLKLAGMLRISREIYEDAKEEIYDNVEDDICDYGMNIGNDEYKEIDGDVRQEMGKLAIRLLTRDAENHSQ